jgi:hypothetical protein
MSYRIRLLPLSLPCPPISLGLGFNDSAKEGGDTLWNKIQIKWKELKVNLVSIKPWFSTKNNGTEKYSINKRNCDRGLIPKEIFARLKKRNPKIDIKLVKKITSSTVKYHIIETFLA